MFSYNTTVPAPLHGPYLGPAQPLMAPPLPTVQMQPPMAPAPYSTTIQSHDHMGFVPMAAPMPMQQPMICRHPLPLTPIPVPLPPHVVPVQMAFCPLENQHMMAPMPIAHMPASPPPQMIHQYHPVSQPQIAFAPMENQGMMVPIQQPMIFHQPLPAPLPPPPHIVPVQYQTMPPPPHIAPIGHNQQMMAPSAFAPQQAHHHHDMAPQPAYMEPCTPPMTTPCPGAHQPPFIALAQVVPIPCPAMMPQILHSFPDPDTFDNQVGSPPPPYYSPSLPPCPPSPIPPPPCSAPLSGPPLIRPYSPLPGAARSSDKSDDLYKDLDCPTSNDDDAPSSPPSYGSDTEDDETAFLAPPSDPNVALISPSPSSHYSDDLTEDADTAFLHPPSASCPSTPPPGSRFFLNPATPSTPASYVSGGCTFYLPAPSTDSESSPSTPTKASSASTALSPYSQPTTSYDNDNFNHDGNAPSDYLHPNIAPSPTRSAATALSPYAQSSSPSNNEDNEGLDTEDAMDVIDEFNYDHDVGALAEYLGCAAQLSERERFEQDDLAFDCPHARAPSTTSVEDVDSASTSSSSWSSSFVRLSSSGSESIDEDAISVTSYHSSSSRSFERGGCTFYPPPPPSTSVSGDVDLDEPRPLDDVQQLLQPSSAHSILRQFRPASQRDVVVAALSEAEAAAYIYASFNRPVDQPQFEFTKAEIDELVSNQLRLAREESAVPPQF